MYESTSPGSLGERLQSIRKRRGLSQRELAGRSGVSVSLIRQIEQGARRCWCWLGADAVPAQDIGDAVHLLR